MLYLSMNDWMIISNYEENYKTSAITIATYWYTLRKIPKTLQKRVCKLIK